MVAGLLSFGLLHIKSGPIKSWQALFLTCGGASPPLREAYVLTGPGLTIFWGVAVLLFLPDSPMKATVSGAPCDQ